MTKTFLLADDHAIVRRGLRAIIESESDLRVVGEARTGREAVAMAAQLCPDVVVMDISMPDLNGVEATRRIITADHKVHVVALSMYVDQQYVTEVMKAGAMAYVVKSGTAGELLQAVRAVLAGRRYFSPQVKETSRGGARRDSGEGIGTVNDLTSREREVLQLVAEGATTRAIAKGLGISECTVNVHRRNIKRKLRLCNVAALTRCAIRGGLTRIEGVE
ncbi:MAG: response regulator [Phycisphaerae bacterium]